MAGDRDWTIDAGVRRLYIFGAGGHGRELAWLAGQVWPADLQLTFLVDDERYLSAPVDGIPVRLLADEDLPEDSRYIIAIGDPAARARAAESFDARGATPATLVHPRAEVSAAADIAEGAVVCAGSILTTNVRVGRHTHVNVGCTLAHDDVIGPFTTLSPGVHLAGHVQIGSGVFIGLGANVIDGTDDEPLVIGDGATIAAGACVLSSVQPGALMAGVPAVRKR